MGLSEADEARKEAAFAKLEEAMAEILSVDQGTNVMLNGYVLKMSGKRIEDMGNKEQQTVAMWAQGDDQDIFKTLGLTSALTDDVSGYYAELYEE